jgi:subtilase family serine protease
LVAAAAKGISFQFSSGDGGDGGLGTPVGAPGVPAVAPHATAVGGTTIVNLPPGTSSFLNLGWGDDFDLLVSGNAPTAQPDASSFYAGSGGGSSVFWPKPAWQAALPGYYRQTPDISALADPYTGVPIVTTIQTGPTSYQQVLQAGWGGTSLSSPIFTATWAIADQRAGHPLGQAAPTIAGLQTGIIDVLPNTAPFSGAYTNSSGTTTYTANSLFAPLSQQYNSTQNIFASVWNLPADQEASAVAFGFDSSLTVTPGWDNVTGYGTPHGLEFINAAASY